MGYGRIPTTKVSSVENNFTSYTSQNSHFKMWLPMQMTGSNRPLSSSKNPHLENETKRTTLLVRMSFISMRTKNHFHIKGWELNLVLIERPGGTRKWSIGQISWTTDFLSDSIIVQTTKKINITFHYPRLPPGVSPEDSGSELPSLR